VANYKRRIDSQTRAHLDAKLRSFRLLKTLRFGRHAISSYPHLEKLVGAIRARYRILKGSGAQILKLDLRSWHRGPILIDYGSQDRGGLELSETICCGDQRR